MFPPGAQRLPVPPRGDGGLLRQAQSVPGASKLVDLGGTWRIHREYSSTISFVEVHHPPGAHVLGLGGAMGGPGIPRLNREDSYTMPLREGMADIWLEFTFVSLPHGWTGIRADAVVARCPCTHH